MIKQSKREIRVLASAWETIVVLNGLKLSESIFDQSNNLAYVTHKETSAIILKAFHESEGA